MGTKYTGGSFVPDGDYATTGAWTFAGAVTFSGSVSGSLQTFASPTISGVVAGGATYTAPTLTSPVFSGATTASGTVVNDNTLTAASYAPSTHVDYTYSKITLTPTSVVTAANGLNAFRGEVNITAGKTFGDSTASYLTGVYGRVNFNTATVDIGSGAIAAVYGKFDLGSTSTLTSGHLAPVQSNIVNPSSSAHTEGVALFYGESASGTPIGTGIELYMAADYFMTLTQVSGGSFFGATAPTSLAKSLKIKVGGTNYYIGLYTAAS